MSKTFDKRMVAYPKLEEWFVDISIHHENGGIRDVEMLYDGEDPSMTFPDYLKDMKKYIDKDDVPSVDTIITAIENGSAGITMEDGGASGYDCAVMKIKNVKAVQMKDIYFYTKTKRRYEARAYVHVYL